jgi:hypothetical protein
VHDASTDRSHYEEDMQILIRTLGGIEELAPLLSSGKEVIQMLVCWALSNLALDGNNP